MPYTPIVATLGYVLSPDRRQVLMIHRNTRPGDHHLGKYNGLGGKVEPDEDVATGMRREIQEEAGIDCTSMQLRGTISWPGFGKHGEDWFGFVFVVDAYEGTPHGGNHEGRPPTVEGLHHGTDGEEGQPGQKDGEQQAHGADSGGGLMGRQQRSRTAPGCHPGAARFATPIPGKTDTLLPKHYRRKRPA